MGQAQARSGAKRMIALLAISTTLAGCEQMRDLANRVAPDEPGTVSAGSSNKTSGTLRLEERDIEAPSVFSMSDKAIWDGRPSFGGVWVAIPGSVQPERVRIVNTSNGMATVGALFKREEANSGPKIELSSDAANALQVLPGTPVEVQVTALRRETVEIPPDKVDPVPAPTAATEDIETATLPEPSAPAVPAETVTSPTARPATVAPTTPVITEVPAAAPVTEAEAEAVASSLAKPFIQVGTFASQSNATSLVEILGKNNVTAQVSSTSANGRALHRVLAGPAITPEELSVISARVAALGFGDAFPVAR